MFIPVTVKIFARVLVFGMLAFTSTGALAKTATKVISFEAKLENGKKIWAPAEIKIESGKLVELKVHNSLPEPHGFTIAGYIEPQTIGAGETRTFAITPRKSEDLKVACHLHPAHVPATLKVN